MIKIIEKSIDELIPYENNARINDNAVEAVANSIQEFGFKNPIIIDKDGVIVAGHTRLKALEKLGIKKAPCIIADDLTEEQIKAFRIADNSTAQIADWDLEKLNAELATIDFDMSEFGLAEQIKEIEQEFAKEVIEDEVPEVADGEPITKLGDIWQLGEHRLMCGDSTKEEDVAKLMNGNKADIVFTDPPYGVDYEGINNDSRSGLEDLLNCAFSNMFINSKEGASVYCFHSDRCADIFHKVFRKYCHFSSMIIWEKQSLVLSQTDYQSIHEPCMYGWFNNGSHNFYGDRKQTSVWKYDRKSIEGHTTPKPIELICNALNMSSKKQENILDLFGGSGSTLIACEQLNRTCYMMELDPKYCDVIIKRYETLTGQKAVKIEG